MESKLQLTDGTVLVRPYRLSDVEGLYEAVRESIAELSTWMPWCHSGYSVEESRAWVESRAKAWANEDEYSFTITSE
jgi:ribosomal-protein-serine acetyltransferase